MTRLNKFISECGIASRRKADEYIEQGRVNVNGKVILDFSFKIDPDKDIVEVDGEKLRSKKKVYFLLNKPKGIVTTTSDEKHRTTVVDLIKTKQKIFPVGRLDYNTTGVLLLTNDGEFTNYLTHPSNKVPREYVVTLDKPLKESDKRLLKKGIRLDKRNSKFVEITFPVKSCFSVARVITVEGRNHYVKRMFSRLGYLVKALNRTKFGMFDVNKLNPGSYKKLSEREVNSILKT